MGILHLNVKRGATLDRTFTWWNVLNTTPRNLSGYTFALQARETPSGPAVVDLSMGSGITLVDAPNGVFRVVVAAAVTAAWSWDEALYDLRATDAGGAVSYPVTGRIYVTSPVTS